ncbi:MAG: TraR/DksA C4-type zinc finger protein [Candidatus Omnitrophica bacterium]|nr:TraR/DksA C4-type zinc finger protein [Candidatus Omnitrophota bacterium]
MPKAKVLTKKAKIKNGKKITQQAKKTAKKVIRKKVKKTMPKTKSVTKKTTNKKVAKLIPHVKKIIKQGMVKNNKVIMLPETKLTKKELDHFKSLLLERKEEMVKEIFSLKTSALNASNKDSIGDLSGLPLHQADIASDVYETDFLLRLASDERERLYAIDDAIKRIEDKTYGQCIECECMIPKNRLEAFPQAQKCIKCKQASEQL